MRCIIFLKLIEILSDIDSQKFGCFEMKSFFTLAVSSSLLFSYRNVIDLIGVGAIFYTFAGCGIKTQELDLLSKISQEI